MYDADHHPTGDAKLLAIDTERDSHSNISFLCSSPEAGPQRVLC